MPGLDPGIHQMRRLARGWIAGSSPAMTTGETVDADCLGWNACLSRSRAARPPTPPISPRARRRPRCAPAVTARTASRRPRTSPRWPASPISSSSGSSCSFAAGSRKNEQMQPIVEQLNNEDIRNLGAYFASLTPPKASSRTTIRTCPKKGAQAAAGRRCASCHTDSFAGTKAVARARGSARGISGQGAARLQSRRALRRRQAAMADVAYPLSEEEITALAHYLAHLDRPKQHSSRPLTHHLLSSPLPPSPPPNPSLSTPLSLIKDAAWLFHFAGPARHYLRISPPRPRPSFLPLHSPRCFS